MKDKIIVFFIGLFLGAIISTGSIYFYMLASKSNDSNNFTMPTDMGEKTLQNDVNNQGNVSNTNDIRPTQDGTNPPEKPDGNNNVNQE